MPPSKPSTEPPSETFGECHVSRKPARKPLRNPLRNCLRSTTPVPECRSREPTPEASECAASLPGSSRVRREVQRVILPPEACECDTCPEYPAGRVSPDVTRVATCPEYPAGRVSP